MVPINNFYIEAKQCFGNTSDNREKQLFKVRQEKVEKSPELL